MPKPLPDMSLFSIVEDAQAIITCKGIYYQVDVYERDGRLFAAYGKGFARLLASNHTTVPTVRWDAIEGIAYREEYNGAKRVTSASDLLAAE